MDVEIVRMSSRGQFVLPHSLRKRFGMRRGEKMIVVEENGTIVMRPVQRLKDSLEDEIYLMQRAARAWEQIEKGKARKMGKDAFLKELSAW
ncbi:MAG: AbrB/MazE/SpoVT family DNA-binding domain-containing protein [Candidatus Micrarchaeota archaeon]